MSMNVVIAIPARMGSSRFPGKPLCDLMGKPMIQWVVEAAKRAHLTDRIVVATPDLEIVEACNRFGAEAVLTREDHLSGTDRLAELSQTVVADVYLNVQGDEPLISVDTLRACASPLCEDTRVGMASVWSFCSAEEEENPAVVKVVTSEDGFALYFSRYAIPYARSPRIAPLKKHVGIYGYRREVLQAFSGWKVSPLEAAEGLEQLRFLEHGVRIKMAEGVGSELAVDTPEQAQLVREILSLRNA